MTAIPASLFVQFIQQGLEKSLLKDITKTLDGEYYCNEQYLEKSISELVEKNGKYNKSNKQRNSSVCMCACAYFSMSIHK